MKLRSVVKIPGLIYPPPATPGQRHAVLLDRSHLWKGRPYKPLTSRINTRAGRCRKTGRITVRHRQRRIHREIYRIIDFKRTGKNHRDVPAKVLRLEYDPNRSASIALVKFKDSKLENGSDDIAYILAPEGLQPGDWVEATRKNDSLDLKVGNTMPLKFMPVGTEIHNVEFVPNRGGQIARSAGTACVLLDKRSHPGYVIIRMQSKELRLVRDKCVATVGRVSNPQWKHVKLGKAGRARWAGKRPSVRGVAMNPIDHPNGGGEGKQHGNHRKGNRTPTGKPAHGTRTRNKKKHTQQWVLQRRPLNKNRYGVGKIQ